MECIDYDIDFTTLTIVELCVFIVELKHHMSELCGMDEKLTSLVNRCKWYLSQPDIAYGFVNHITLEDNQKKFLKSCPCIDCRLNIPCNYCGIITPFDVLNVNGKYRMACRPKKHICLKCKINKT